MRRTSHSPSTTRRAVLRKPSPLLSPTNSSNRSTTMRSNTKKTKQENSKEELAERNVLLLASTPNLAIKMEGDSNIPIENEQLNEEILVLKTNLNEKIAHEKQLSEPPQFDSASSTQTDN